VDDTLFLIQVDKVEGGEGSGNGNAFEIRQPEACAGVQGQSLDQDLQNL
jgi:hypothetical protein